MDIIKIYCDDGFVALYDRKLQLFLNCNCEPNDHNINIEEILKELPF